MQRRAGGVPMGGEHVRSAVHSDMFLEKAVNIERALGHLAKAIELDLVDVALNPEGLTDEDRARYAALGQRLAELSGISYELVMDISQATGIPLSDYDESRDKQSDQQAEQPLPPAPAAPKSAEASTLPQSQRDTQSGVKNGQHDSTEAAVVQSPRPYPETPEGAAMTDSTAGAGERQEESELYKKIVDPARLPVMRPVEESEAIIIKIVGNNTALLSDQKLILRGHELYVFNALLLLRDASRSAVELKSLGFYPNATQSTANAAFARAMQELSDKLNRAVGKEVVKRIGAARSTAYAVNPKLVVVDLRETECAVDDTAPDSVKKNE